MTQEQKAKAYDRAIEYAHYLINERCKEGTDGFFHRADLQKMFPELQESEDERVRENCIHFLELQKQHHAATFEIEECIAWLEKQGKLPIFKASDWYVSEDGQIHKKNKKL